MDFFDFDEYHRLLEATSTEPLWGSAITAAGEAGLRMGEVLGLHWDDVDLKAKVLNVRRTLWQGQLGSPKGGRARRIPMTSRLEAALRQTRHLKGKFVWSQPNGEALTKKMAERAIQRVCRRAGLRQIGWHMLRHTFCSHLAMRGAAPKAVQELAGHSDITTTMKYMHLAPTALLEAIDLLNDRPRSKENAI